MQSSSPAGRQPADINQRHVALSALGESCWVEAGAGTGKTTLLIGRLLNLVLSGSAGLEEIAAITFTEKAAAELKLRLREELEERLSASAEASERLKLHKALGEIEYGAITTIHSFAAVLLRERPVEAGIDPGFEVIDSGALQELLEQAWESWFGDELLAGRPLLRKAFQMGCTTGQLKTLAMALYAQRDLVAEAVCPPPPAPDESLPFPADLKRLLPELRALQNDCRRREEDAGCRQIDELTAAALKLAGLDDSGERERFLLRGFPSIAARGNQANWADRKSCRRQKEICGELKDSLEQTRRLIGGRLVAGLAAWGCGFIEAAELAKERSGVLDFHDLLLKARNLLRGNADVRAYFQQRFRYLLVDEFQDTDPLQVEIVFLLAADSPDATSWHEASPIPGKLFLVGDPKQSIYRFRRADIEIYQEARRIIERQGRVVPITQNFRTLPLLVDWVNDIFSALILPCENYQPAYEPLIAYRPPGDRPSVVLLEPPVSLEDQKVAAIREAEASAIAAALEQAVGSWQVTGDSGSRRPLSYGDCALLFPTTTGLELYEDALQARGIPYRLEGGRIFFQRGETAALKNLLTVLGNPYDRLALVAVLRYWFGISDEELYLYHSAAGSFDCLADPPPQFPQFKEAFALLGEMHRRQEGESLSCLIEELLERTWFWQRLGLQSGGRRVMANIQKILAMVRARDQERPLTTRSFGRWLELAGSGGREEAESQILEAGGDAVQLLTIHKAKGLEFPLVVLANLASQGRNQAELFLGGRLQRRFEINLGPLLASAGYEQAATREAARREAEQARLYYVAATRARDYLLLPRFYGRKPGGFWEHLESRLGELKPEAAWPGCFSLPTLKADVSLKPAPEAAGLKKAGPAAAELPVLLAGREQWLEQRRRLLSAARLPGPYHSVSSLARVRDERLPAELLETAFSGASLPVSELSGAALGSAFHQVMEEVDLYSPDCGRLARQAAEAAHFWGLAGPGELERLLRNTLKHPLLERARRSSILQRELPFVCNLQGSLIEGIVDLLFLEQEGLVIADYKTDRLDGAMLEQRWPGYRRQGEIYALAMAEITRLPVKEVCFLFVRSGLLKSIEYPDLPALKIALCKELL